MPGISVSKICVPFGGGGIDWSSYWATQFTTAAGITDATQIAALKIFVGDLIAINDVQTGFVDFDTPSNSILKACYPFVGGTADRHKINLINPADTDAAFRLHYSGTITHDEKGFKGNGTNGFADTHFVPSAHMGILSGGIDVFLNSGTLRTGYQFVVGTKDGANYLGYHRSTSQGMYVNGINFSPPFGQHDDNAIGFSQIDFWGTAIGNARIIYNGTQIATNAALITGNLPNTTLTIGRLNNDSYYSSQIISYVGIRIANISDAANILYKNAIVRLQKALNRFPDSNVYFEGDSRMGGSTTLDMNRPATLIVVGCNATYSKRIADYAVYASSGAQMATIIARYATILTRKTTNILSKNFLVIWVGINDLYMGGKTGAQIWADMSPYIQTAVADGFIPVVLTILPKTGLPDIESERDALNVLIKTEMPVGGYYVDLDLIAELADPSNTTYYHADGLHLNAAGYQLVAPAVVAKIISV